MYSYYTRVYILYIVVEELSSTEEKLNGINHKSSTDLNMSFLMQDLFLVLGLYMSPI